MASVPIPQMVGTPRGGVRDIAPFAHALPLR